MSISKEERAEWRKEHSSWHGMSIGEDSEIIVRLLDALEAAEAHIEQLASASDLLVHVNTALVSLRGATQARAEAIENRADEVISDLVDSHRNMEVRAENAERERDVLIELCEVYQSYCTIQGTACWQDVLDARAQWEALK